MKKLLTICLLLATTFSTNAQNRNQKIVEIKNGIIDILENAKNTYMENGAYQRVTDFKFDTNNDCLLTYFTFSAPVFPGTNEQIKNVGWRKVTLDFSKIKYIGNPKKTNYGFIAIPIYSLWAGEGEKAIECQSSTLDVNGYSYYQDGGDTDYVGQITIPIDSMELVTWLKEYKNICNPN